MGTRASFAFLRRQRIDKKYVSAKVQNPLKIKNIGIAKRVGRHVGERGGHVENSSTSHFLENAVQNERWEGAGGLV